MRPICTYLENMNRGIMRKKFLNLIPLLKNGRKRLKRFEVNYSKVPKDNLTTPILIHENYPIHIYERTMTELYLSYF